MMFWIMLVGVCAAFSISNDKSASTNAVLGVLTIFCFSAGIYIKYFLGERDE